MAIDMSVNKVHNIAFPSFVASAMGQYGHVINLVMKSNMDNGTIAAKGNYVSFEQYEAAAPAANSIKGIIREASAEGGWYVEFTQLPSDPVYFVYNSPVSPYPEKELRDEALFYNATGDVTQGMELHLGDIVSLSDSAFIGTPADNTAVTYTAGKYVI